MLGRPSPFLGRAGAGGHPSLASSPGPYRILRIRGWGWVIRVGKLEWKRKVAKQSLGPRIFWGLLEEKKWNCGILFGGERNGLVGFNFRMGSSLAKMDCLASVL